MGVESCPRRAEKGDAVTERLRRAEARVVREAVRQYETWERICKDWNKAEWVKFNEARIAEERAVRALLALREGERK